MSELFFKAEYYLTDFWKPRLEENFRASMKALSKRKAEWFAQTASLKKLVKVKAKRA